MMMKMVAETPAGNTSGQILAQVVFSDCHDYDGNHSDNDDSYNENAGDGNDNQDDNDLYGDGNDYNCEVRATASSNMETCCIHI